VGRIYHREAIPDERGNSPVTSFLNEMNGIGKRERKKRIRIVGKKYTMRFESGPAQ